MNNLHAIKVLSTEIDRYRWEYSNIDKDINDAQDAVERAKARKIYLDEYLADLKETLERLRFEHTDD